MPLFDDESNKRIRYHMKMRGHPNYISNEMSRFTLEQISYHWETFLNPQLYHVQMDDKTYKVKSLLRRKLSRKLD
ncbi:unnamed protein product [Rhizophagus irregularis]|uniref:Uncharacterized protein n=1 Tax=Rhizophagus irregularis TaxID=588596 RepID=A0A2I1E193_9GLOM|nr:hypothetical protein RhiirB3_520770 [Rhizophagus irregularis]CAB4485741.1 unnamed protein product [Rhizophagus irregularis]CAB5186241.1 unnamed protein product [Rhizophagus irregularis]CAB5389174.1 unnamed protein product [Rhizophagus irregularis]